MSNDGCRRGSSAISQSILLLWCSWQYQGYGDATRRDLQKLVLCAFEGEAKTFRSLVGGRCSALWRSMFRTFELPTLTRESGCVFDLKQESDALAVHVRICAGGRVVIGYINDGCQTILYGDSFDFGYKRVSRCQRAHRVNDG